MRVYDRKDLADLAFHYENRDGFGYKIYDSIPKLGVTATRGKYRKLKEDVYYNDGNLAMSKTGKPNSFDYSDEFVEFDLDPYGGEIARSEVDLSQPDSFGRTRPDMIREAVEFIAAKAKLNLEIRGTTFLTTSGNYHSSLVRDVNAASTKWSDLNNSDPLVDVQALKEAAYGNFNKMRIGIQLFHTLQRHPKITGSALIQGASYDGVNPNVTPGLLASYFDVPEVIISRSLYNTTPNKKSMTKGFIWDSAYVALTYESPMAGDSIAQPSFCHSLFYDAPGFSNMGGFIGKEEVDETAGLVGLRKYIIGNYQAFEVRAQKLGGLLTNVWSA